MNAQNISMSFQTIIVFEFISPQTSQNTNLKNHPIIYLVQNSSGWFFWSSQKFPVLTRLIHIPVCRWQVLGHTHMSVRCLAIIWIS